MLLIYGLWWKRKRLMADSASHGYEWYYTIIVGYVSRKIIIIYILSILTNSTQHINILVLNSLINILISPRGNV